FLRKPDRARGHLAFYARLPLDAPPREELLRRAAHRPDRPAKIRGGFRKAPSVGDPHRQPGFAAADAEGGGDPVGREASGRALPADPGDERAVAKLVLDADHEAD